MLKVINYADRYIYICSARSKNDGKSIINALVSEKTKPTFCNNTKEKQVSIWVYITYISLWLYIHYTHTHTHTNQLAVYVINYFFYKWLIFVMWA